MQVTGTVISQRQLAEDTYCLRISVPEIAGQFVPGQFLMIRPLHGTDPILGRPFALYDVIRDASGSPVAVEFAYHVVGKLTELMSQWSGGEEICVWGPLGNGFPAASASHLMCVGGGIGYTPFPAVIRQSLAAGLTDRVTFCYAAQKKAKLADLEGLEHVSGVNVQLATDDGSQGHHGLVTDLVREALNGPQDDRPGQVFCCGPEPMMKAVAELCEAAKVTCWLSLETPMACGFGACFSCVTKVKTDDGWDYRRTCVEGPIFPAECLEL